MSKMCAIWVLETRYRLTGASGDQVDNFRIPGGGWDGYCVGYYGCVLMGGAGSFKNHKEID